METIDVVRTASMRFTTVCRSINKLLTLEERQLNSMELEQYPQHQSDASPHVLLRYTGSFAGYKKYIAIFSDSILLLRHISKAKRIGSTGKPSQCLSASFNIVIQPYLALRRLHRELPSNGYENNFRSLRRRRPEAQDQTAKRRKSSEFICSKNENQRL